MRASELEESAAIELKNKLPSLNKTDYTTIDKLMQRISKRHKITGKKLHDLFVSKYGSTPDHWIKKYKKKLDEAELAGKTIFVIYIDGKPATKYVDPSEAEQYINYLKKKFPNKTVELKKQNELPPSGSSMIGEGVESPEDEQKIKDFIEWSYKAVNLQKPYPKFTFSNDTEQAQQGHHTGRHTHDGTNSQIWVYTGNRNLIDIFRTIFHEIVHERQFQLDMIGPDDSHPGSPIEAMADMMAGKYIKIYGKKHPEIFQ
jgi:hypothetical protein